MEPIVRHMLLCDDAQPDPGSPRKVNVCGLVSIIQPEPDIPFPLSHPELCVYLQVTGGRGAGQGRIVAVRADTDQVVFASAAHPITFGPDPLAVLGIVFRIQDCVFPEPGLYWIQFRFNGKTIAYQPLLVKDSSHGEASAS
jgi:hypothetical protein